jgi:hypothetical protein
MALVPDRGDGMSIWEPSPSGRMPAATSSAMGPSRSTGKTAAPAPGQDRGKKRAAVLDDFKENHSKGRDQQKKQASCPSVTPTLNRK